MTVLTAFIGDEYRWVLLTASIIAFHFTLTGFIVGGKRGKTFNKEFMEQNFKTEHERYFPGQPVPRGGYPDMGNGRFSEKLAYKEWFLFNVGQRIHYNYLESVTIIICWVLISGIKYPWVAVAAGGAYVIARIIYHIGYETKGPSGRVAGFIISQLSSIVLFVVSILSPLKMAGVY